MVWQGTGRLLIIGDLSFCSFCPYHIPSQVLNDGTNTYLYGAQRLASVGSGGRTWELHDALGSVRLHLDDAGAVQHRLTFDAFGTCQ
jgi:hypothetical protein